MRLFLVRHTHATSAEENARRPLSGRGRDAAARIARFFSSTTAFRPSQYWHSPLARAAETARFLLDTVDPGACLVETDDLLPNDDPLAMARRLADYPDVHDLALVGHEPHLAGLAGLLVRDKAQPAVFAFRKGAVLALERMNRVHKKSGLACWTVRWHLSPEILPL